MLLYVVDANITYASHQIQAIYLLNVQRRPHTVSAIAVVMERGRERDGNENMSNKEMEKSVRKTWNENENQTNPTKQIIYDKNHRPYTYSTNACQWLRFEFGVTEAPAWCAPPCGLCSAAYSRDPPNTCLSSTLLATWTAWLCPLQRGIIIGIQQAKHVNDGNNCAH